MPASRRTLVFDIGGVVVRWQPQTLVQALLPALAPDVRRAQALVGDIFQGFALDSDWADFDRGVVAPAALAARLAARTGYPLPAMQALIDAIPDHLVPMPESLDLLARLRAAGHRLTLLSNMPPPYIDHLLARHACFADFDAGVFSGHIGLIKPEPAMFDHARQALALDLQHTLFIDDNPANTGAAQALGWQALHFENAAQCEAVLRRDGWV